jgi:S1-C subfamily serine protease
MTELPLPFPESPQPSPQPQPEMQAPPSPEKRKRKSVVLVAALLVCLVAGSLVGFSVSYGVLNGRIDDLQSQVQYYTQNSDGSINQNSYVISDNVSLAGLYQQIKSSVVVIQDIVPQYNMFGHLAGYSIQQGSGFVTSVNGQQVIVTNYHVVETATNITVTFADGDSYSAELVGSDEQADLAVLEIDPMPSGIPSLTLVSSSNLDVGDPVVAVGSPYGLSGTLTAGIVSALGRTITVEDDVTIADMIQTSTAINPGNSGGPLINYAGEVVGITTAAVSNSQGLGFATPADTLIREIVSLVNSGSYDKHPSLNAEGVDMNYQIAQAMNVDITYGWLVERVYTENGLEGGDTQATILGSQTIIGGDIIIGIGDTTITNVDDLLSYLEKYTLPDQSVAFTVIRDGQTQTVTVEIGSL